MRLLLLLLLLPGPSSVCLGGGARRILSVPFILVSNLLYDAAGVTEGGEDFDGLLVPATGGALEQGNLFGFISRYATALGIHICQLDLRIRNPLVGAFLQPEGGFDIIARDAFSFAVIPCYVDQCAILCQ
ncbi:hypothetical protein VZ52_01030 [Ralstonia mannitolilytica]|nr:hypothetical protein VZ52_01030 [Ralstonia mannitolilytica]